MEMPRFMTEGYDNIGGDEQWHIKDDALEWAKKEFQEFYAKLNPEPDKDGNYSVLGKEDISYGKDWRNHKSYPCK